MVARSSPKLLALAILAVVFSVATVLTLGDVRLASSQTVTLVAYRSAQPVPLNDPSAEVWDQAAAVEVPLSAQNTTPPMGGEERTVTARALHDGARLYVRLEWADDSENDSIAGQNDFSDAAAVQFPVTPGTQVPPFCMGDPNSPVNIWQWKAAWQAALASDQDALETAYPNRAVDLYPFEREDVFYPPRAAGNVLARANRKTPVDNLLAGSFGTLTAAEDQVVNGMGAWNDGRWRVVFARDLTIDGEYTQFAVGRGTHLAVAVWDGAKGERDGIKSVSQFLTLNLSSEIAQEAGGGFPREAVPYVVIGGLAAVLAAALAAISYLRRRAS